MSKYAFGLLIVLLSTFLTTHVHAEESVQESPEPAAQDAAAAEEAPPPPSLHMPRLLEAPKEPPESSPAQLAELREEQKQLELLIEQDIERWKAYRKSERDQTPEAQEVRRRIARHIEQVTKVKNELAFLTGSP